MRSGGIFQGLDRTEGVSQQDCAAMEEFQQRINAVSLEKVKAYYRRLRYTFVELSQCLEWLDPLLCDKSKKKVYVMQIPKIYSFIEGLISL